MPIKYVPFIPEPVEGQAVLGNFNRILKYKGADDVSMTLQRGMPLYEMEKQETVGENADGNMVIRGECVSACAYLKEQGIQVDLVYIDPPFASGADYAKKVYIRRNPKVAKAIAQAEQELDVDELKAFEEKMYGDVWDKDRGSFSVAPQEFARGRETPWLGRFAGLAFFNVSMKAGGRPQDLPVRCSTGGSTESGTERCGIARRRRTPGWRSCSSRGSRRCSSGP